VRKDIAFCFLLCASCLYCYSLVVTKLQRCMMKWLKASLWCLVILSATNVTGRTNAQPDAQLDTQPTTQLDVQSNAQLTGALTIEVSGLNSQEGNVCFKVFSGSTGFPNSNESAVQRACVAIAQSSSESSDESSTSLFTYTFENLPFNTYAVAVYHDRNGDEQLNRGAFGMPSEGYGFSNDAPANLGPASYGDAAFLLAGTNTTIQITMRYSQ
jgi:uncharacterized protein (DUF2141 family)